jgi:hypothetical protein
MLADQNRINRIAVSVSVVAHQKLSTDAPPENGASRKGHFGRGLAEGDEIDTSLRQRPLS